MDEMIEYLFYDKEQKLEEAAKQNIDKNTKRKVVFPDGTTIVFQNRDIKKIDMIREIIYGYY